MALSDAGIIAIVIFLGPPAVFVLYRLCEICSRLEEGSAPTITTAQPRPPPLLPTTTTQVLPAQPRPPPLLPTTASHVPPPPVPLPREPTAQSTCFSYGLITAKCCAICLEEFVEQDKCEMLTKCNHMYHHHCIKQWQATGAYCPLCRVPMAAAS